MRAFKLELRGVTYQGAWIELADGLVEVRSAYGVIRINPGDLSAAEAARRGLSHLILPRLQDAPLVGLR